MDGSDRRPDPAAIQDICDWIEQKGIDPDTVNRDSWDFSNAKHVVLSFEQKVILRYIFNFSKPVSHCPKCNDSFPQESERLFCPTCQAELPEAGLLPFREVVYSAIKKSGKTTIAGLVGAYVADQLEAPNLVICAAGSQEQSAGRIFSAMGPTVYLQTGDWPNTKSAKASYRLPHNGTTIQAIPVDAGTQAGMNYGLVMFSELWQYKLESERRFFEELIPVPTRKNSMRWIETYAGYEDESKLLLDIFFKIFSSTREVNPQTGEFELHPDARLITELKDEQGNQLPCFENKKAGLFCLHPKSQVRLSNGLSLPIRDICKGKKEIEIIGYDERNKNFGNFKINGWYQSKLNGRSLFRLSYLGAPRNDCTYLTGDHAVLTKRGWIETEKLIENELIATERFSPNEKQYSAIIGMLLGDAHLLKYNENRKKKRSPVYTALRLIHGDAQAEWLEVKRNALAEIGKPNTWAGTPHKTRDKICESIHWESKASYAFYELRQAFYPDGKKVINRKLVEKYFSDELLAAWYLDDGSKGAESCGATLYTNGFTLEDVTWICGFLNLKGIESKVYTPPSLNGGSIIHLSVKGFKGLIQRIGRFTPPSMRYKLPENAPKYDSESWNLGLAEVDFAPVIKKKLTRENIKTDWPDTVYCIDIDKAHSFISGGIVVHNCYWDHARRMPWQKGAKSDAYYENLKYNSRRIAWLRHGENRWQMSSGEFIHPEWLTRATRLPKAPTLEPMIIACDGSKNGDSTALVGVIRVLVPGEPSHPILRRRRDHYIYRLAYQHIWEIPKGKVMDFDETLIKELEWLAEKGAIQFPVYYDEYQLHQPMLNFGKKMKRPDDDPAIQEFPQQTERTLADTFLHDAFRDDLIELYDSDDGLLATHIGRAKAHELPDQKIRLIKGTLSEQNKIDGCVALSMAVWKASNRRIVKRRKLTVVE